MSTQVHPTSIVSREAELGRNVTIEPLCVIHANVLVGEGSFVGSHSVLGAPTANYFTTPDKYESSQCRIGRSAVIRSHSVVYAGADVGDGFSCGHRVTIREGSVIGEGVRIGTDSDLQGHLSIGDFCRLHSGVFIAQYSTVEELVWIFPRAVLLNDPHPPSDTCTQGPTIRRYAVIGASATIFPSVEVGESALVGAMALVRRDVAANAVVSGVPEELLGATSDIICRSGRLNQVYPWWTHFRRGYPEGTLPDPPEPG